MYRLYTIDELYTQIERRRRIIATITYLSVRQSGSNPTIAPRKQTVSTVENDVLWLKSTYFVTISVRSSG